MAKDRRWQNLDSSSWMRSYYTDTNDNLNLYLGLIKRKFMLDPVKCSACESLDFTLQKTTTRVIARCTNCGKAKQINMQQWKNYKVCSIKAPTQP